MRFLVSLAVISSITAFSTRPQKRPNAKGPSSFASTRRVFCFTLTGGAHTLFSSVRRSNAAARVQQSSTPTQTSSTTTSLNYRSTADYFHDEQYCNDMLAQELYIHPQQELQLQEVDRIESRMTVTLLQHYQEEVSATQLPAITSAAEKKKDHSDDVDDTLGGIGKAFIPVAVEIGFVAVTAANFPF